MIYQIGDDIPNIHESVFVAQSADVMGKVILKEQSSVWFNAVIRGDCDVIEVGKRSNIQDGAVLHADPGQPLRIGEDVTVGHQAMVHCREIGDRTLVGIQAVVLDGAVIGKDCLIAANALVKAGSVIPDGSMVVGSPGKVIRQ
ncbi:gamma carbonic anhydrase family protein, partial [Porticoccaceae bacterium]|nr:gamma carbonic anhydrase family protein [Porticoccaceae bacterium]